MAKPFSLLQNAAKHYAQKPYNLLTGNSLEVLKNFPDNYFDGVASDPPYGLSIHKPKDIREALACWLAKKPYVHGKKGMMGKCYHPDTEVLTHTGWKKIEDVKIGDMMASLTPKGELEYVPCVKTYSYTYKGKMYRFKHRSAEQFVTPNHNIYARTTHKSYSLVRADELPTQVFYLKNQLSVPAAGKITNKLNINGYKVYTRAFLYLLGLYIGDGYRVVRRGTRFGKVRTDNWIGLSVKKERKVKSIRHALRWCGFKHREHAGRDRTVFELCQDKLFDWFSMLGKARGKHIPRYILDLDHKYLRYLYKGLMETDGCTYQSGQEVFSTTSKQLADDFQELCLKLGKSCVMGVREPRDVVICGRQTVSNGGFVLSVSQPGKEFYCEQGKKSLRTQDNLSKENYSGPVHCVELAKHHILYTRLNGKPVWSGNSWDGFVPGPEIWDEVYRVLKPGGWILIFAGTRTVDLMTVALRLSGFEIRDCIGHATSGAAEDQSEDLVAGGASVMAWAYGQGMPKSLNVSKSLDKEAGAKRKIIGKALGRGGENANKLARPNGNDADDAKSCGAYSIGSTQKQVEYDVTQAATAHAKARDGYGSSLKPSWEPIIVARKPLDGTLARNVRIWGTGCLNIDGCRVGTESIPQRGGALGFSGGWSGKLPESPTFSKGRWPANVVHDGSEAVTSLFPKTGPSSAHVRKNNAHKSIAKGAEKEHPTRGVQDLGGSVARFFYSPKAHKKDRDEGLDHLTAVQGHSNYGSIQEFSANPARKNNHPTVKPTEVMRWLLRLLKHPSRDVKILDPFMGSGTTGKAAMLEGGIHFTGIDLSPEYTQIAKARCFHAWRKAQSAQKTDRKARR